MKYEFESGELNPESLEKSLGLKRGDISSLTVNGAVTVDVADTVASDTLKAKILEELNKRGYPKGKKPK